MFKVGWRGGVRGRGLMPVHSGSSSGPANGHNGGACSRHSNGLDQFFAQLQGESGLRILDLAGASQANINFITNLGHNLYSEDVVSVLDTVFGSEGFNENQYIPERIDEFLQHSLNFPDFSFDGALVWDILEFLSPPLLRVVVSRLFNALRPGSYLFALFHTEEKAESFPLYNYRIAEAGTLHLTPRGFRKPAQFFNNRALENLFQDFGSVKFFLTRDSLREVIVRR